MRYSLKIQNLSCLNVLKDISIDIDENSKYLLIGKSGSGKTTFLKCLANLIEYTGYIDLYQVKDKNTTSRNIGLFMNESLLLRENPYLNIIEPLINTGVGKTRSTKLVNELSNELGITPILFKPISELSYSERKMIIFARSIIHDPTIVLLDNLLEGLDSEYTKLVLKWIKNQKNKTIILASNTIDNIDIFNKTIVLDNGNISYTGKTLDLLENEKLLKDINIELPIIYDLSNKLKSYKLIDEKTNDIRKLVNFLWK